MDKYDKIPDDIKYFIDGAVKTDRPNYEYLKEQIERCWPTLDLDTQYQVRTYLADRCGLLNLRKQKEIKFLFHYLRQRPADVQTRFQEWRKCNEGTIIQKLKDDNITVGDFYKWIIQKFEGDYTNKYFGRVMHKSLMRPDNPNSSGSGTDTDSRLHLKDRK